MFFVLKPDIIILLQCHLHKIAHANAATKHPKSKRNDFITKFMPTVDKMYGITENAGSPLQKKTFSPKIYPSREKYKKNFSAPIYPISLPFLKRSMR